MGLNLLIGNVVFNVNKMKMKRKISCLNDTIKGTLDSFFIMKAPGHKLLKHYSLGYATSNEIFPLMEWVKIKRIRWCWWWQSVQCGTNMSLQNEWIVGPLRENYLPTKRNSPTSRRLLMALRMPRTVMPSQKHATTRALGRWLRSFSNSRSKLCSPALL